MLKDYLKLCRTQTSLTVGALATLGAICCLGTIFDYRILELFIFGMLVCMVGNSLNDYWGLEGDKKIFQKNKPLVTGDISLKNARSFIFVLYSITIIFGIILALENPISMVWLFICAVSCTTYNWYDEKYNFVSILLSVGVLSLVMFSASIISNDIPIVVYIIAFYGFLENFIQSSECSDLKDIEHDQVNDARKLGANLKNGVLHLSTVFILIFLFVHLFQILMIGFWALFFADLGTVVAIALISGMNLAIHIDQLLRENGNTYSRSEVHKYATVSPFFSMIPIIVVLIAVAGAQAIILPLAAAAWYFSFTFIFYKSFRGNC